ncbi:WecB/TagA/CpsF family glycosyltransferase [Candidatus Uhrbacteria bacterium]|nr:WecB/TagA/CpsF family glycosyltransferase [Candidatus Uhrbacteria bacterium]
MDHIPTVTIAGVRVDDIELASLYDVLESWLQGTGRVRHIVTVNPEYIMEARKNKAFRKCLERSALALADGVGIVYAARYLYGQKIQRITGVDAVLTLADLCARASKGIYLLGADTGVAKRAADELEKRFPGLRVSGSEAGPFNQPAILDRDICERITTSGAHVLLVAFGSPKQDLWIARHMDFLPGVRIAIGVGGTFDYLAGVVRRAPGIIRTLGFEWLYRLMRQPHRWRRIFTAIARFPLTVIFSKK